MSKPTPLLADLASYLTDGAKDRLDDWLDEARDHLIDAARADCSCATNTKPCEVHDAYDDGICDLIDAIQGATP